MIQSIAGNQVTTNKAATTGGVSSIMIGRSAYLTGTNPLNSSSLALTSASLSYTSSVPAEENSFVYTPAMEFVLDAGYEDPTTGFARRIDASRAKVENQQTVSVLEHSVTTDLNTQSHLENSLLGRAWETTAENTDLLTFTHSGKTRSLIDFETPAPNANMATMRRCTLVLDDADIDMHTNGVPTVQVNDKIQQLDAEGHVTAEGTILSRSRVLIRTGDGDPSKPLTYITRQTYDFVRDWGIDFAFGNRMRFSRPQANNVGQSDIYFESKNTIKKGHVYTIERSSPHAVFAPFNKPAGTVEVATTTTQFFAGGGRGVSQCSFLRKRSDAFVPGDGKTAAFLYTSLSFTGGDSTDGQSLKLTTGGVGFSYVDRGLGRGDKPITKSFECAVWTPTLTATQLKMCVSCGSRDRSAHRAPGKKFKVGDIVPIKFDNDVDPNDVWTLKSIRSTPLAGCARSQ